ncbi:rho GTPase-activating protein 20-like [Ochotona curzoniae]|uniref:rho GTPase-activating protein 20-like n=1 Tax=Ochotona curzoniae TaxID=130825 RepID=UPI001B345FA4|nr:rho GTPase-activating protein 20-like [Ochotona curzoniae]
MLSRPCHTSETNDPEAMNPLENPPNPVLVHGPVKLTKNGRTKKHQAFLYDEVLLISNSKFKKKFTIKYRVPVNNIWFAESTVGEGDSRKIKSLQWGWPMQNFNAEFLSVAFKEKWHRLLERSVVHAKQLDGLHNTLVKIHASDVNNTSCSTILSVHNLDTIRDVINLALPELGLTGSERDYQLWVHYGKTEAPFPLMGHENPYAIQAHYHQASLHQQALGKPTSPCSLLESIPEILADGKLQFILKCRNKTRPQVGGGFLRNCMSCWGVTADQNDLSQDTDCYAQPNGLELEDLTAVTLEMLHYLKQKGPSTKGIFQNIDDIKSFLCLKEKIMFGYILNCENESPLVVAAALKDCLRIIPGTLFTTELYDKWLRVLDEDEEKVTEIKRLLQNLPVCNLDILRQLFSCLHEISKQASFNLMSAPKLAFCITTSIFPLWTSTSNLESELLKKISIVEFFIENYARIFEEHNDLLLRKSWENPSTSFGSSTEQDKIVWEPENSTELTSNTSLDSGTDPELTSNTSLDSGTDPELTSNTDVELSSDLEILNATMDSTSDSDDVLPIWSLMPCQIM